MQAQAYEHPVKTGARRIVRQFFIFWLIGSIAIILFMLAMGDRSVGVAVPALLFGFLPGSVLLLLYRLARFAVS